MATDIPDRIGPYEIMKVIGRGGMGVILLAFRPDLEKPCVIKLMLPELSTVPRYREMFANEARVGAQLRHGRIVGVFDRGELPDGRPYFVMERVDGVNLGQLLKAQAQQQAGLLELGLVVFIVAELLEAVAAAHDRMLAQIHDIGVIHRDITPGNVLISSRGEVLLTDFGIARWVDESGVVSRPVGTLLYMAPEQLMGQVSRQSDLYAVGAILHELLTGTPPLGNVPASDRREALLMAPIPATDRNDLAPQLDALRVALLQRHPEKRLRKAEDGLRLLAHYCGPRATSLELRDQYLRVIGSPSSGWTDYLESAQARGTNPAAQCPSLMRWRQDKGKRVAHGGAELSLAVVSERLYWENDPEDDAEGPGPAADDDDLTLTRPWEASPPRSSEANAADPSVIAGVLEPRTRATSKDRGGALRTKRFRRRVRHRSGDHAVDHEGRVVKRLQPRRAVMQPAARPSPEPATAAPMVGARAAADAPASPRVPTEKLPAVQPGPDKTEPSEPQTPTDAPSRTRVGGVLLALLTATVPTLDEHPTQDASDAGGSEVLR